MSASQKYSMAPMVINDSSLRNINECSPSAPISDPNKFLTSDSFRFRGPLIPRKTTFQLKQLNGDWETYEIYKFLGGGAYGEVYEAQTSGESDRRFVAIKFLKKAEEDKEIKNLQRIPDGVFNHKNLVRYRAIHPGTAAFQNIGACANVSVLGLVIMDVARFGSAIDWVLKPFRNRVESRYYFPDRIARRVIRDVISGLTHLSRHNISQ